MFNYFSKKALLNSLDFDNFDIEKLLIFSSEAWDFIEFFFKIKFEDTYFYTSVEVDSGHDINAIADVIDVKLSYFINNYSQHLSEKPDFDYYFVENQILSFIKLESGCDFLITDSEDLHSIIVEITNSFDSNLDFLKNIETINFSSYRSTGVKGI